MALYSLDMSVYFQPNLAQPYKHVHFGTNRNVWLGYIVACGVCVLDLTIRR